VIVLVGGTGYVGGHLGLRLAAAGEPVCCLVRRGAAGAAKEKLAPLGLALMTGDLEDAASVRAACAGARVVVSLAHIRYAPVLLDAVPAAVQRLVLVSSQRLHSGVASASVAAVRAGEQAVAGSPVPCVTLRPTMIFGPGDDRNLSRVAGFVRRHGWFPVCGCGRALQQPVYVGDVVEAMVAVIQGRGRTGGVYDLAGPEPLPFDQVIDLVGEAVGRPPVKVHVPVWLAVAAVRAAQAVGARVPLQVEQVLRLQEDRSCSIAAARLDLGFAPLDLAAALARSYPRTGAGP
jgi:nucleoside-diphosphate-sugar epimerase